MNLTAKELVELTKEIDQKCIDFAEWVERNRSFFKKELTTQQILEIYKKEKK